MTISRKISLSFFISAIALTAASVVLVYHVGKEKLQAELFTRLSVTAQSRAHHVNMYLDEHVRHVELCALDETFMALLAEPQRDDVLAAARRRIAAMMDKDDHIQALSVVDTAGTVVASNIAGSVGAAFCDCEIVASCRKAPRIKGVHVCQVSRNPVMAVSAPVLIDGGYAGAIVQHLHVHPLYEILMERTGLGNSGEAYLVNREGCMVSPSRFIRNAVLKQKVDSDNFICCLRNASAGHPSDCRDIKTYSGYREVKVLGTHEYIPQVDWCLLVEIDSKEVLAPLRALKALAYMLLVSIPLAALLIGVHVSRIITAPIKKLHRGAGIIGRGDLTHRVGATERDEIGDLGRAFDDMAEGLGKATTTIDRLNEEIEEREHAQKALRESKDLFERTLRSLPSAVFVVDDEKVRILNCNRAATEIFGYGPEEMLGKTADFLHVDEIAMTEFQKELHTAIKERGYLNHFEFRMKRKDGSVFPTEHGVMSLEDESGKRIGWVSVVSDITERKRAEKALMREKDRAQRYLDVVEVIIMVVDVTQRVTSINRKGCEVLGRREHEIVGLNWFDDFMPADVVEDMKRRFDRFVAQDVELSEYSEHRLLTKNGDERLIAWHSTLLKNEQGKVTGVLSSGGDITDRRRAEAELVKLERLKALGDMAAGVSHNLNNILVGVLGHAQLMERVTKDPDVLKEAEAIVRSARRAENLVERLMLAVSGQDEELEPVDLVEVVSDVVEATRSDWSFNRSESAGRIDIQTELGEPPPVRATRSGLAQILNNLIENAAEAISNDGEIRISADQLGDSVLVKVADTGKGMQANVRSRILEPFFTTKAEVGKGLGLSTVYGLLTRWGGSVNVESEPERGTIVTITLPCWRGTRTTGFGDIRGRATESDSARSARILIVDDEEIVTRTLREYLCRRHEIKAVENAQQALENLTPGRFDVVLIDLGLPGVSGDLLACRVRELDRDLITVLMTGWSIGKGDPRVAPFDFWLRKPFGSLRDVEEVIHRSLELREERLAGRGGLKARS